MLDPKLIRNDPEQVFTQLARRGGDFGLDKYQDLEEKRKRMQVEVEECQAELKKRSKAVGQLKAAGEDSQALMAELEQLKKTLKEKEEQFSVVHEQLEQLMLGLPNIPDDSVPDGKTEDDNREVETVGVPTTFTFDSKDHSALGEAIGQLDFPAAAKIAGARFTVAYDDLARLHRALGQYMLDLHIKEHGYREVYLPSIVNKDSLIGTGQLPKFGEDLFHLTDSQFYLIPTSEVPLVNLYRDTIIDVADLPIKLAALTACFRSEAGAAGKDTRGMIRQHQFEKVELVQITTPDHSAQALEEIRAHAQTVLNNLGLAHRVVELCTGDLGFAASKTYDIEVWLPSENAYREISSCSNTCDFQARRLKLRMRRDAGAKTELVHTLNGSGVAVGRAFVAILENYQTDSGGIEVPEVLQAYMGGQTRIDCP